MSQTGGVILCLAYILGLLSTAVPWGGYGVLALGSGAALLKFALGKALPNFWRVGPKPRLWLAAGVVGFLATLYLQARTPEPTANDNSQFISSANSKEQK